MPRELNTSYKKKLQKMLDYLHSLNQEPVVISSRRMTFKINKAAVPIDTKNRMLNKLEELGAIEWYRTKKFQPIIKLKKRQI